MKTIYSERKMGFGWKRIVVKGVAGALAGALALAPAAAAAGNAKVEVKMSDAPAIDRGRIASLQRWVNGGHADWCKDARLVAAEELWRLAPDFSGDSFEMSQVETGNGSNAGNRETFEWAPVDGRAVYRVRVERFDWLLPIAKTADAIVWVPTGTEIRVHE